MSTTFDDNWLARQEKLFGNRVRAVGFMLVSEMRQLISVSSRTVRYETAKPTKRQLQKAEMIRRGHQLLAAERGQVAAAELPEVRELTGTQVRKRLGKRGSNRSKPGEPPHKDYGRLRQSVAQDFEQSGSDGNPTTRAGSNLAYAKYLELGTKHMRPRPWIRRTLKENRQRIVDMISRGESNSITVNG